MGGRDFSVANLPDFFAMITFDYNTSLFSGGVLTL
jgi:hypothetical protein